MREESEGCPEKSPSGCLMRLCATCLLKSLHVRFAFV